MTADAGRRQAVFLDRDGVLLEDVGPIMKTEQVELRSDGIHAIVRLKTAGFLLIVVTNQAVVARGLATESEISNLHMWIDDLLLKTASTRLDGYYFCPHHPHANDPTYRSNCRCRKPSPGMLLRASKEHRIALDQSFMIGDRVSDIEAGHRAGCRAVLVETGQHRSEPIVGMKPDTPIEPDYRCSSVAEAADWIVREEAR